MLKHGPGTPLRLRRSVSLGPLFRVGTPKRGSVETSAQTSGMLGLLFASIAGSGKQRWSLYAPPPGNGVPIAGFSGRLRRRMSPSRWLSRNSSSRRSSLRSEEHTSELQSQSNLVCRLLLEKKKCPLTPSSRPIFIAPPTALYSATYDSGTHAPPRSVEHTSDLQSPCNLGCRSRLSHHSTCA